MLLLNSYLLLSSNFAVVLLLIVGAQYCLIDIQLPGMATKVPTQENAALLNLISPGRGRVVIERLIDDRARRLIRRLPPFIGNARLHPGRGLDLNRV